jgi:tripartite-type tricarboxylate transporter receptor subunit TctC
MSQAIGRALRFPLHRPHRAMKIDRQGGIQPMKRRTLLSHSLLAGSATLLSPAGASAQTPLFTKPLKAVVPFAAGGVMDAAASFVAKSEPDGHTFLVMTSSIFLAILLSNDPPVKISDLLPVTQLFDVGIGFAVATSLGVNDFAGYLKLIKDNPGKYSYGTYGAGTGAHIIMEVIKKRTGVQVVHVPYRGEAPGVQDMLAGQISSLWGSMGSLTQHPQKMKVIAVANPQRMTRFPDVPTFKELGFDMGSLDTWGGTFTAQKSPPAIVRKLTDEIDAVMAMPDVQQKMREFGYEPLKERRLPFSALVDGQAASWKAAIEEGKVSMDS